MKSLFLRWGAPTLGRHLGDGAKLGPDTMCLPNAEFEKEEQQNVPSSQFNGGLNNQGKLPSECLGDLHSTSTHSV